MPFCCHDYTMNSDFIPHPEESFGDVFAEIVLSHNSSMFRKQFCYILLSFTF